MWSCEGAEAVISCLDAAAGVYLGVCGEIPNLFIAPVVHRRGERSVALRPARVVPAYPAAVVSR